MTKFSHGPVCAFFSTVALFLPAPASAQDTGKILPTRVEIRDANGNARPFMPIRVFTEYQYGTSTSEAGLTNPVDYTGHRMIIGADFLAQGYWYWGVALAYSHSQDAGSSQYATIATEKDAAGAAFYVAKPIHPDVMLGGAFSVQTGSGSSVYNSASVNNEDSVSYAFSPFVSVNKTLTDRLSLEIKPTVRFSYGDFKYDLNVPATASVRSTTVHLPVVLSYAVTDDLSVSARATLNHVLDAERFANVPSHNDTTLTIGGGASYAFGNGMSVYGAASHELFDSNYNSTSVKLGLSYAFN